MTRKLPRVTIWTHHDIVWQGLAAGDHALETHAHLLAIIAACIAKIEAIEAVAG